MAAQIRKRPRIDDEGIIDGDSKNVVHEVKNDKESELVLVDWSKKKGGPIWKLFKKNKDDEESAAFCGFCSKPIFAHVNNMKRHLAAHHSKEPTVVSLMNGRTLTQLGVKVGSGVSDKRLNTLILVMMIKKQLPLNFMSGAAWKQFVGLITGKTFKSPSRKTVNRMLSHMTNVMERHIKDELSSIPSVSLTTDCWTSNATEAYASITVHYIKDWKMRNRCLAVVPLKGSQTGEYLASVVKDEIKRWGLANSFHAITTDSMANNGTLVESLKKDWPNLYHVRCFAHKLNLVVCDALQVLDKSDAKRGRSAAPIDDDDRSFIGRLRRTVAHFHMSTLDSDRLKDAQRSSKIKVLKLRGDSKTRFNSTVDMMIRLIHSKKEICYVWRECPITDEDWSIMPFIIKLLQPVKEAAETLGNDGYPTLSNVLILSQSLAELEPPRAGPKQRIPSLVMKFYNALTQSFKDRLITDTHLAIKMAAVLDPRLISLSQLDSSISTPLINDVYNELIRRVPPTTIPAPKQKEEKKQSILGKALHKLNPHLLGTKDDQVSEYMKQKPIESDQDPLIWWQSIGSKLYCRLSEVAQSILAIPATSIPSERVFSTCGNIVTKKRSRLLPSLVNKLVFLHENAQLFDALPLSCYILPNKVIIS